MKTDKRTKCSRSTRSAARGCVQRVVRGERPKFKMDVWQNCRPGNKFPVVCKRTRNKWHISYVGHAWAHWQTAAKEGRELLALAKASNNQALPPMNY